MRTDLVVSKIRACVDNGGKLLVAGNGGSASQAEHFVCELVCDGIPAIALTNAATITAIGNDIGFEFVFSSQVMALGKERDTFIGLTTSGQSENIRMAEKAARIIGMDVIRFPTGGDTQAVQERHLCLLHDIWLGLKGKRQMSELDMWIRRASSRKALILSIQEMIKNFTVGIERQSPLILANTGLVAGERKVLVLAIQEMIANHFDVEQRNENK